LLCVGSQLKLYYHIAYDKTQAGGRWTIGKAPDIAQLIEEIILEISHNKAMRATQDQLTGIFLDAGGKIKLG
jgi:hypothetical protein